MDMIKEDPIGNMWTCQKCVNKIEKAAELSKPLTVDENVDEVSGKMNTTSKKALRIMQWNAESISIKLFELRVRLEDDDIDVCLIQESHLHKLSPVPNIIGYKLIRADRVATVKDGCLPMSKYLLLLRILVELQLNRPRF